VQVETVGPSVSGPALLQRLPLIARTNAEFGKCYDHRPNAYVRFGGWANMPALGTPDNGSTDVSGRADAMQHSIELIPQFDYLGEGKVRVPSATEFCDHLRKPGSLRVARWHLRLIVSPSQRFRVHSAISGGHLNEALRHTLRVRTVDRWCGSTQHLWSWSTATPDNGDDAVRPALRSRSNLQRVQELFRRCGRHDAILRPIGAAC
jgi:hypothetical protein